MDTQAGVLLTEVRREAGLTQAELARRAGTSQAMVARYETGAASPTVRTLKRLLRAAGRELVLSGSPVDREEPPGPVAALLRDFPAAEHGLFPLLRLAAQIEELVGRPVHVAAVEVMTGPVRERALAEAAPL